MLSPKEKGHTWRLHGLSRWVALELPMPLFLAPQQHCFHCCLHVLQDLPKHVQPAKQDNKKNQIVDIYSTIESGKHILRRTSHGLGSMSQVYFFFQQRRSQTGKHIDCFRETSHYLQASIFQTLITCTMTPKTHFDFIPSQKIKCYIAWTLVSSSKYLEVLLNFNE